MAAKSSLFVLVLLIDASLLQGERDEALATLTVPAAPVLIPAGAVADCVIPA